jgi:hypothetical protein
MYPLGLSHVYVWLLQMSPGKHSLPLAQGVPIGDFGRQDPAAHHAVGPQSSSATQPIGPLQPKASFDLEIAGQTFCATGVTGELQFKDV